MQVTLKWEKRIIKAMQDDVWEFYGSFFNHKVRLGYVVCKGKTQFIPMLDICRNGEINVKYLQTSEITLEKAQKIVNYNLFLESEVFDNVEQDVDIVWQEAEKGSRYFNKTWTLVISLLETQIRIAHIVKNVEDEYVMFLDSCKDNKVLGVEKDLEKAKNTILEKYLINI
jgi:hypothetical protein